MTILTIMTLISRQARLVCRFGGIVLIGLLVTGGPVTAGASQACEGIRGCDRKVCELKNQLKYAQEYNNEHREKGLQRALRNVRRHCRSDDRDAGQKASDSHHRHGQCQGVHGCKRKVCELEQQKKYARDYGNKDKERGVDKALSRARKRCHSPSD